jgi:hypothetical protein
MELMHMKQYRFYASNGDYLGRFTFSLDQVRLLFPFAAVKRGSVYLV